MKNLNYKEMEICSLNVAGWKWRASNLKWEARLSEICKYIKSEMNNPFVIALQEVQIANGKSQAVLEDHFPDYHIVLPEAYDNKQSRSIVSVLLINKNLCESYYNVRTLKGLEDSLRYNFVDIDTYVKGLSFRVLNVHIPHNCQEGNTAAAWYIDAREDLRSLFIQNISALSDTYRSEPDLKFIVLGDFNASPKDSFIESLAYSYDSPMLDAVKKCDRDIATWIDFTTGTKNRLDYLLYSRGMLCNTGVTAKFTITDNYTTLNRLSDHAILVGGISVNLPKCCEESDK